MTDEKKDEQVIKINVTEWKKNIGTLFMLIGILFTLLYCVYLIDSSKSFVPVGPADDMRSPVQTSIPTIAPTPTPEPVPMTSVITFTALYCTLSDGKYTVVTSDNRILAIDTYYNWNEIVPQGIYVGELTDGIARNIHLIGYTDYQRPYIAGGYSGDYPQYYSYDNRYYQYDGRRLDEISYKSVRGERLRYERPPRLNPPTTTHNNVYPANPVIIE